MVIYSYTFVPDHRIASDDLNCWIDDTTPFVPLQKALAAEHSSRPHSVPSSRISSTTASLCRVFNDCTNISNSNSNSNASTIHKRKFSLKADEKALSQSIFKLFNEKSMICKHEKDQGKSLFIPPRSFQHHIIPKWLKENYSTGGFELFRDMNSSDSPCDTITMENIDWISYRYLRKTQDSETKEVLCRFCVGKNWLDFRFYFKHLLFSHGIITKLKDPNEPMQKTLFFQQSSWDTVIIFELLPLPDLFYSFKFNTGNRRTHVKCPSCYMWIRLGWCEYDEILDLSASNDVDFFKTINLLRDDKIKDEKAEYEKFTLTQKRDRSLIDGFYENYFKHYVECNEIDLNSLYVDVT
ncbi:hypothetical protein KAFR_0C00350 [Kazachstania africana CBS 2517]|uniref:Transcription regulator Rua1 C-terminal domain-containing protein n=1 Tax=Kazachstania africana (strain ATCC 22294 / BCRC 22015 / CBS 2517 / CECT 1963 / NBRC 1671 / NRRL Y-8276) TaxID=1071382 RepID=H2ARN1_KAZAF|nr:hypothetical protein KAFR_0C00350 [Kazachstania africana CBS 2517]CCF57031.1 hypothetical protein KAFR_0C00350 [Kazachstania africana CBS 2517]